MLDNPFIGSEWPLLDTPLGRSITRFIDDLDYLRRAPSTLAFYRILLRGFCRWLSLQPTCPDAAGDLTAEQIRAFLVFLRQPGARWHPGQANAQTPVKTTTEHAYARAIRAWLNWCVAEELIPANPMYGKVARRPRVPMPRVDVPVIHPFTEADITALLACCDPTTAKGTRDEAIIYFLLDTGLRASELCRLRLVDYDPIAGTYRTAGAKRHDDRTGALAPRSRRAVNRWLTNFRPLYPTDDPATLFVAWRQGDPPHAFTTNGLGQVIRQLGRKAGLSEVRCSPHTFRHTFAVMYLINGGDPATLQLILDHKTLTMTLRYVHMTQKHVAGRQVTHAPTAHLKLLVPRRPATVIRAPVTERACAWCHQPIPAKIRRQYPAQRYCGRDCYRAAVA